MGFSALSGKITNFRDFAWYRVIYVWAIYQKSQKWKNGGKTQKKTISSFIQKTSQNVGHQLCKQ
jgi:hypothetical protein